MTRREFSRAQKAQIVHRAMNYRGQVCCESCGLVLGHKKFEIDHTLAEALVTDKTKPLVIEDGRLLGLDCCHKPKTRTDKGVIAKAVRRELKIGLGIRKASSFRSKWKKKINGEVVLR